MSTDAPTRLATRISIHAMVAVGGVAALSWEVLWQLNASLALGVSALGTAITLATTMAGITVGSLLAGRFLRSRSTLRPIRLYGALEALIGLSGIAMLPGFALLERLDSVVYAASPGLAPALHALGIAVLLGPPTLAMGATVPLFAQIARSYHTPVAALYGINTLGASVGVVLIAFVLVPALGVSTTCQLVALLNLAVFAATWVIEVRQPDVPGEAGEAIERPRFSPAVAGTVVFFTGWVTFGLEIAWFRSIRAAFGSVTDSFAIMLGSVLLALGVGARLVPRLRKTQIQPATLLLLAGVGILIVTPLVERMDVFASLDLPYGTLLGWRFLLALLTLGPPMLLLGMVLPWLLAEFGDPERCGWLYGSNTLGAVFGSLFAAWVLLPWLGFARSAWLMGLLIVAVAAALSATRVRMLALVSGGLALAVATIFTSSLGRDRILGVRGDDATQIVAFEEGPDSTVSVVSVNDGARLLVIDGFVATSENLEGEFYMQLMGRLPMLLHPDPKNALVICFGTGQTANALREENPLHLDIVELSPAVLSMASHFESNRNVLGDERVRAVAMDGRAWLRRTDRLYDVVTLEPMPPLFAGVNALYSKEFYELVARRLAPGGVVAQWLPLHIMPPSYAAAAAAAFQAVFPDAILWVEPNDSSGILLGRTALGETPLGAVWPGLARSLETRTRSAEQFGAGIALDREALSRYAELAPPVTDDNQKLAYGSLGDLLAYGPTMARANLDVIGQVAREEAVLTLPGPGSFAGARPSETETIQMLERVRGWRPDDLRPLVMLVVLYERAGRHADARAVAAELLAIEPDLHAEKAAELAAGLAAVVGENEGLMFTEWLRSAGIP